jgi:colicin import membrane protein
MNSSGLWQSIKANPVILLAVIAFHFVLIILLSINLTSSEVPDAPASTNKTVKAVMVDVAKIEAEAKKLKQAEEKKKQQALAQQKKIKKEAEKAKKQLEAEKKRLAALKKKQVDEKKRLDEIKKKKAAEKKKAEAEKKRIADEKRKKEAEQKRLAELEEKRRQEEQAELKKRLEDEERQEAEALRQAEHNRKLNSLRAQYVKLIEQKVAKNWIRPATSTEDMSCEVIVTQTSLGDVTSVGLQQCATDLAFQRSIERAVRKASPLPPPPSPEVFDREIHFTFRPGT